MTVNSVGFMGAGRVARIFLGGWARTDSMPERVVAYDIDPAVFPALRAVCEGIETTSKPSPACRQELVFLAVHPPAVKEVAPAVREAIGQDAILVSLAPKCTIAKLIEMLGGFARIARVISNAPSIVGRGLNPVAFAPGLPADARRQVRQLLAPLGDCMEVAEEQLEAYAVLSGMGPTYFWPQLYELKALGVAFGLSAEQSLELLEIMLNGTVSTLRDSGLMREEVMDLIPARPMQAEVDALVAAYRAKLGALREKLRP